MTNIEKFFVSDLQISLEVVEEAIKINEEIKIRTDFLDNDLRQLKDERDYLIKRIEKGE